MTNSRLETEPVILPALGGALALVWETLLDLSFRLDKVPWVLVGGQMVFLHGLEHQMAAPRVSADIDAAVDVRADPDGIHKVVACLNALGFDVAGTTLEGFAHRFVKPAAPEGSGYGSERGKDPGVARGVVDVLAPEGLGPHTDIMTAGGKAFPAPGMTQALDRVELVPVSRGPRTGRIPRPNLLGAIVAKSAAATKDHVDRERHLTDLAFLCALIEKPMAQALSVTPGDRRRLRAAAHLLTEDHPAWLAGAGNDRTDAQLALAILADIR